MTQPISSRISVASEDGQKVLQRLLLDTGRHYIGRYALAFFFMALAAGSTALVAYMMRDLINEVFINQSREWLIFIGSAVMAIYLVKGASMYFQMVIMARIGNAIVADVQNRMFRRLLEEDVGFVQGQPSAEIAAVFGNNANAARQVLNLIVTGAGRDVLTLLSLLVVMVIQDPIMSLTMIVALPVLAFLIEKMMGRVRRVARQQVSLTAEFLNYVRETAQGFRIVKAFRMEDDLGGRIGSTIDDLRRTADKIAIYKARPVPLVETIGGIAVALVIFYGGYRVIEQGQSPGEFFSFVTALLLAYEPARKLANLRVPLEAGLVGVRMMYGFLDRPPSKREAGAGEDFIFKAGEVRFEDVSFSYDPAKDHDGEPDTPVLRNLTFTAQAGKTTALVGASGAGKSTVMAMVLRFWDPTAGQIRIDDQNLADLSSATARETMAYVGQDAYLFDGTVGDNIRAGLTDATQADIEEAAKRAEAHAFVSALPQGYETPVGELGSLLSGGQRQRIAIARAFLRNAPILLLDEPTSALDAHSEDAIQATLARLSEGRTTLVIAHRLSTVRAADKIVAMDEGRAVEQGRHDELIAKGGLYAKLYDLQFGTERLSA
ncbi:MAG: ABC transporter ATP-binding protein [Pseudomonadota bacterium]